MAKFIGKARAGMSIGMDAIQRTSRISLPVTADEKEEVRALAAKRGLTIARYLAELVVADAKRQQAGLDISEGV